MSDTPDGDGGERGVRESDERKLTADGNWRDADEDDRLLAALRAADRREPWTVDAVRDVARNPAETKATAAVCASCDAPCAEDEVCMTATADEVGLFDEVERERAFHLIESAAKRLRTADKGQVREEGDRRPNVFFSLSTDDG